MLYFLEGKFLYILCFQKCPYSLIPRQWALNYSMSLQPLGWKKTKWFLKGFPLGKEAKTWDLLLPVPGPPTTPFPTYSTLVESAGVLPHLGQPWELKVPCVLLFTSSRTGFECQLCLFLLSTSENLGFLENGDMN